MAKMVQRKQTWREGRKRVIPVLEKHYGVTLNWMLYLEKWFTDATGTNYMVLVGKQFWYSIPEEVIEAECNGLAQGRPEGILAIGHVSDAIDVFIGSLGKPAERKGDIYKNKTNKQISEQQYQFKGIRANDRLFLTGRKGVILTELQQIATILLP